MLRVTIPVSQLSLMAVKQIKFKFSYEKTKENLSNLFQTHDTKVKADKILNPLNPTLVNVPQSFIDTAFALTKLFISEYQKGKAEGKTIRFTWSYLKRSLCGSKLTIRSLQRHVDRFLNDLTFDFIKVKFRSTLNEVNRISSNNTSCIALEISPLVVRCVDNSQTEAWEKGLTDKVIDLTPPNNQIFFGSNDEKFSSKESEPFSGGFLGAVSRKFAKKQPPKPQILPIHDPIF